jgi:GxxExxY protein
MEINEITSVIIEESINIHRELGPGLLESVYEEILYYCLTKRGLKVARQHPFLSFIRK